MNKYQKELADMRPYDEVYSYEPVGRGYNFIDTAGHGYLVVPKTDIFADIAKKICAYGYIGQLAYYLEEDCEYSEFMRQVGAISA